VSASLITQLHEKALNDMPVNIRLKLVLGPFVNLAFRQATNILFSLRAKRLIRVTRGKLA
jgi:hypothetical protein